MKEIIDLDDVHDKRRELFHKIREELFALDDGLTEEELLKWCREWWNEELKKFLEEEK